MESVPARLISSAGRKCSCFLWSRDRHWNRLWNRWKYFSWVGFRGVTQNGTLDGRQSSVDSAVSGITYKQCLNEIEGILIEIIEPLLNKQGGKLGDAVEYFQVIPDTESVTLESLNAKIDALASQLSGSPVAVPKPAIKQQQKSPAKSKPKAARKKKQ